MNAIVAFIAGGLVLGAGFIAGRVTADSGVARSDSALGQEQSHGLSRQDASGLNEIVARLQAIADRLDKTKSAAVERTAERASSDELPAADMMRQLKDQVTAMLEDVHLQTADMIEVGRLKPIPDLASLNRLSEDCNGDSSKVILRINGMDYRDATRSFGTPTIKRAKPDSAGKVIEWWWDMPDSNRAFMLEFVNGVTSWGGFMSREGLTGR